MEFDVILVTRVTKRLDTTTVDMQCSETYS
jgi:hypothetical protein